MKVEPTDSLRAALRMSKDAASFATSFVLRRKAPPAGSKPGTLAIGETELPPRMSAIVYDHESAARKELNHLGDMEALLSNPGQRAWIDVQGFGNTEFMLNLGDQLGLSSLEIEDIANTPQRPKVERFDDHLLIILRMLRLGDTDTAATEQLSIVLREHCLVTIQERYGDILHPVRQRLLDPTGLMRKRGVDYLGFAIVDAVIDGYMDPVARIGEAVEEIEATIFTASGRDTLSDLAALRMPLLTFKRLLPAHREVLENLNQQQGTMIGPETRDFFREPLENVQQIIDVAQSYRDLIGELGNTHLALLGQRTNDTMRVLTVVASLFIPLTFIAGVYGMNFEHMPGIHHPAGFYIFLGACGVLGAALGTLFAARGWFRR